MDLSFVGGFGLTINHHQRQKGQGGGGYVRKPFTLRQEPFTLCFVPGTERVIVQPSSQECCRLMPYTDQARIASPSHFTPALTNASIAAASPDSAPGRVPRPCKSVRDHVVRLQNPARPTHATYPAPYMAGHDVHVPSASADMTFMFQVQREHPPKESSLSRRVPSVYSGKGEYIGIVGGGQRWSPAQRA